MSNKIKKFFLLPSLLLANAYLLTGFPAVSDLTQETTAIKEKINVKNAVTNTNNDVAKDNTNEINSFLFFSFLAVSILTFSCFGERKYFRKVYFSLFTIHLKTKEKLQKMIFNIIKSFKKIIHCNYFSHFFYSF